MADDVSPEPEKSVPSSLQSFESLVESLDAWDEPLLHAQLYQGGHVVSFQPGHIAIRFEDFVPEDAPAKLQNALKNHTNQSWVVEVSTEIGDSTLAEKDAVLRAKKLDEIAQIPLVKCALEAFPGSEIMNVDERI